MISDIYSSKIWHPYTRFSTLSDIPVVERAEGIYLYTADGRRYVDAISSWWCANLGHSHPRIVAAIREQAGRLQHSILGNLSHPGAMELAERLVARCPSPDRQGRHVVFASDGASAVEAALRIAVQYFHNRGETGRHRFISLTDPYHGDTMGAVSVGFMPAFHRPLKELTFEVFQIPVVDRRDKEGCAASLARLEALLEREGQGIAAMVMESMCQGSAGMKMYCPGFMARAAELCRRHGVLLIVDEIAMGYGRTGTFFAFEQAGIDPDIICLGKGITSGSLPLSVAIAKDEFYETFTDAGEENKTFFHGHTFAGNPIACAAALATLDVHDEEPVLAEVNRKGALLATAFERFEGHPKVADIRCLGLIAALTLEASNEEVAALREGLRAKGYLFRPLGKVIYLMPPFITPDDVLLELVDVLEIGLNRLF